MFRRPTTFALTFLIIISFFIASCGENNTRGKTQRTTATFETSMGSFEMELFTDTMPITTKNFIDLAEKGFYDNTKFHRVIANFMIQGGDHLSKDTSKKYLWGTGGPGYKIKDEFAGSNRNDRGAISMANSGPNTGGSQFFINVVNNNYLDKMHPVFGQVTKGMDIVDAISNTEADSQDKPVEDVIVKKVVIK